MENKSKAKHHKKHGQHLHRPLNAYEHYELEHMPHHIGLIKLPSDHPKPCTLEAPPPALGREVQPHWRPPGGGDGRIFRPDYYEMSRAVQPYWYPPEGDDVGISEENIDAEAEDFIRSEHDKFELSKWMSMN